MRNPRHLLILLLTLLLPVQGFAATYARLHMATGAPVAEAMPCHEQHTAQHNGRPAAAEGMSGAAHDSDAVNHMCCHQLFTCTPVSVLNNPAQKFSDVSPFVLPLYTLFIPDSPDRPPRG
jgi:hypothetical protein